MSVRRHREQSLNPGALCPRGILRQSPQSVNGVNGEEVTMLTEERQPLAPPPLTTVEEGRVKVDRGQIIGDTLSKFSQQSAKKSQKKRYPMDRKVMKAGK